MNAIKRRRQMMKYLGSSKTQLQEITAEGADVTADVRLSLAKVT